MLKENEIQTVARMLLILGSLCLASASMVAAKEIVLANDIDNAASVSLGVVPTKLTATTAAQSDEAYWTQPAGLCSMQSL